MRRTLLSVVALLLAVSAAHADQVVLKNGDRLTGKIITGDGKTLLLKTEFAGDVTIKWRSEEHTSELQSHSDLVCRLLLEKKKNKQHKRLLRPRLRVLVLGSKVLLEELGGESLRLRYEAKGVHGGCDAALKRLVVSACRML